MVLGGFNSVTNVRIIELGHKARTKGLQKILDHYAMHLSSGVVDEGAFEDKALDMGFCDIGFDFGWRSSGRQRQFSGSPFGVEVKRAQANLT